MDKLIKLLNKYLKYKEDIGPDKLTRVKSVDTTGDIIFELDNGGHWNLWYIISKEYGFIKWLVDNDKIDQTVIEGNFGYFCMEGFDTVDSLLMVLAIQDAPIDFLIEILK